MNIEYNPFTNLVYV